MKHISWVSLLPLATIGYLIPPSAQAQITPDNSLGEESSVVTPLDDQGVAVDRIDGGAARGANLFHSFQDFNVDAARGAYFSNPDGINNIFSRVTGINPSNINGVLGVLGNADLFLINPNGIMFGQNARLDLGGSFFASTADGLLFEGDAEFSAVNPEAPPLLEVNIPIGLNFRDNPGNISISGNENTNPDGLEITPGNTLALIGGDFNSSGGRINAPSGRIEIGSVNQGKVSFNQNQQDLIFNYEEIENFGNITLAEDTFVNTRGSNSGDIQIRGNKLNIIGGSDIVAEELGSGSGGNIFIQSNEVTIKDNGTVITTATFGSGNGGNLTIETNDFSLTGNSAVSSSTFGSGNGGDLRIIASDSVEINGNAAFLQADVRLRRNSPPSTATGNGGNLIIETRKLSINGDRAKLSVGTFGEGNSGNAIINASELVEISGSGSGIFARVENEGTSGDGGDVIINTSRLDISNGADISALTSGVGNSGNLTINASESIDVKGKGTTIVIDVGITGTGNAKKLDINTSQLKITEGGRVSASTSGSSTVGKGNAGNAIINASDLLIVQGKNSTLQADVSPSAKGKVQGGDLTIETKNLIINQGGAISTATFGEGDAGNLKVVADESIVIENDFSILATSVQDGAKGNGGDLSIETKNLTVSDIGRISASTSGQGNGGNLIIQAFESVNVNKLGLLVTQVLRDGDGNGGNITINTNDLIVNEVGLISAEVINDSAANSGSININADNFLEVSGQGIISDGQGILPDGQQVASALSVENNGTGISGDLNIITKQLKVFDGAEVSVSSFNIEGSAGNLLAIADSINLDNFASLKAETAGNQGNIDLETNDLILSNQSNITTNATGSSTGGNIAIDTENLIAFPNENSDISANAQQGTGGRVSINAKGIFGTEFREEPTLQSDITATSELGPEFSGEVAINTPEVDPTSGLINLPASVGDATDQISQNPCEQGVGSEFIVTGKGGLPPNVNESLNSESAQVGLIETVPSPQQKVAANNIPSNNSIPEAVPAMGWVFNDKGEVTLTAYSNTDTEIKRSPQAIPDSCSAPKNK